jgi:signal transduction histidine kinase
MSLRRLFSPKLLHKGAILILVPLLFSVGFMLYVYNLTDEADQQAGRQLKTAKILSAADEYQFGWIVVDFTCLAYIVYHQESSLQNHRAAAKKVMYALRDLHELLVDRPESHHELNEQTARFIRVLREKQVAMSLPGNLSLSVLSSAGSKSLRQKWDEMQDGDSLVTVVAEDKNAQAETTERSRIIWNEIGTAMAGGLLVSMLLTLALGAFFYRNILNRLRNVRENIFRMNGRGMLIEPAKSRDEIGDLDAAVHETARRLRELEEYKSRMTGFIGQQLAVPLQAIDQGIQTLNSAPSLDDACKPWIESAGMAMSRLIKLADELLHLDSLEEGKFQLEIAPTTLTSVVQASCAAVKTIARDKRIKIETNLNDGQVDADTDRLIQVLVNLLSNAVKFSPEGSTINVTSEFLSGRVRLSVIDQGRGIPPEFQTRLFDRYSQADQSDAQDHKGFGLGLSICKSIIDEHGGTITCESTVGVGTKFHVELPQFQDLRVPEKPQLLQRRKFDPSHWFVFDAPMWQKGLVILLFPMAFQLGFIIVAGSWLWNANIQVEQAANMRALSAAGASATQQAMHAARSACLYHVFREPWLKTQYENSKAQMASQLALLRIFLAADKELSADGRILAQVDRLVGQTSKIGADVIASPGTEVSVAGLFPSPEKASQIETEAVRTMQLMEFLRVREAQLDDAQVARTSQVKEAIGTLAVFVLAANICLSAMLLYVVWRAISTRIAKVIANTQSLLEGEQMGSPGAGLDEIGEIDRAFYTSAMKVLRLQKFKQELVSVVGHDLRTPLTAVQGAFVLLGSQSSLPEKLLDVAARGEQDSEQLITLITELLEVEKSRAEPH